MCVTHGMPCVIMHGHVKTYKYEIVGGNKCSSWDNSKLSPWEQQGKGEEKGRKGKEEGRKGEEKGKKKREEERGGREEKERGRGRSVAQ